MDDLGLPAESDPGVFARAFVATRARPDLPTARSEDRTELEGTDDLGFPAEGDPGDFASAFLAIRS